MCPIGLRQLRHTKANKVEDDMCQVTNTQRQQQMVETMPIRLFEAARQPPNGKNVHYQAYEAHAGHSYAFDPEQSQVMGPIA